MKKTIIGIITAFILYDTLIIYDILFGTHTAPLLLNIDFLTHRPHVHILLEFALHTFISLVVAWTAGSFYERGRSLRPFMIGLFLFFIILFPLMVMIAESPVYIISLKEFSGWMIGHTLYLLALSFLIRRGL
ncbi:hypothetical protein [Macrococcus brunensis]|uniref:hypothetical protein n=1 Tax=Macrococcus brunensis TaxID=198483 RepID=UPI001EEF7959|nr:hypothetical protein [Macrococcus brunensis]ULG71502.1 hypothetical protein MGG12_09225 [Macrococcus brunensis]